MEERPEISITAPWCNHVDGIETGLMWMRVSWLRDADFVAVYDWETPRDLPEHRVARMAGGGYRRIWDHLGGRHDDGWIRREAEMHGIDFWDHLGANILYLTHATAEETDFFYRSCMRRGRTGGPRGPAGR
jgi:hypothetical protein